MIVSLLRWSGVMPPTSLSVLSTPEKRFLHFHFHFVECLVYSREKVFALSLSLSVLSEKVFCTSKFSRWAQFHIDQKTVNLHFHIYGNPTISYQHRNLFFALLLSNLLQIHKNISTQKDFFGLSLSHLLQSHKHKKSFLHFHFHIYRHFRRLWWRATWSTAASRESWTRLGHGINHGSSNMSKDSLRQVHICGVILEHMQ